MKTFAFILIWLVGTTIIAMIINSSRTQRGEEINDSTSDFMQGLIWGPLGMLSALSPSTLARGRAGPQFLGGLVGSIAGYLIYTSI